MSLLCSPAFLSALHIPVVYSSCNRAMEDSIISGQIAITGLEKMVGEPMQCQELSGWLVCRVSEKSLKPIHFQGSFCYITKGCQEGETMLNPTILAQWLIINHVKQDTPCTLMTKAYAQVSDFNMACKVRQHTLWIYMQLDLDIFFSLIKICMYVKILCHSFNNKCNSTTYGPW